MWREGPYVDIPLECIVGNVISIAVVILGIP